MKIEHRIVTEKVSINNASYYEVTAEAIGVDKPSELICRIKEEGNLDMRAAEDLREFALNTLLDRYTVVSRIGLKVSVRYEIPREGMVYELG